MAITLSVLSRVDAARQVRLWQALGDRVVFTNGCFDLLHVGHVRYLQSARRLGDRLIVGINSDASVKALKGSGRPFVTEEDRAEVVAALRCVDVAVVFTEATANGLLDELQPSVYAKGGDYRAADLPEAVAADAVGAQITILPYIEGRSTSRLIDRLQAQFSGTGT